MCNVWKILLIHHPESSTNINTQSSIYPLLRGASVEALSIEKYKKCMKFLNKYPTLQKAVDDFFNTIYDFSIRLFEKSYFLDLDCVNYQVGLFSSCETNLKPKLTLWLKNNSLYKQQQSDNNYYLLHCTRDANKKTIRYSYRQLCPHIEPDFNPIQFDSDMIYFRTINNLFNNVHKQLNSQYKEIDITNYLRTHENISVKEFFIYLSNNFIQVVNEICDNINKKCDEYTKVLEKENLYKQKMKLFNTEVIIKEQKELNKYIYGLYNTML